MQTSNGRTKATCATCGKTITGFGDVTSNFISHLKVRHTDVHARYMNNKQSPSENSTSQAAFDKKLIRAIVDSTLPVSIVEKESFKDLFRGTGLSVMSRKTAMKKLDEYYNSMMAVIRDDMSTAKYFCTTADMWSGNHRSFLGYTCHWLDKNFQRKSAALACKRVFGVHSAEKIAQLIGEINSSSNLSTANILTTITDNGSNFVKAFREYGLSKEGEDEDSDDEAANFENDLFLPKHERCASHTLNLLATTDFLRILKDRQAMYIQHAMVTFSRTHI